MQVRIERLTGMPSSNPRVARMLDGRGSGPGRSRSRRPEASPLSGIAGTEKERRNPFVRIPLASGRRSSQPPGRRLGTTLEALNNLGVLLQSRGKPAEAEPYFRDALEGRRRVLGDDHPDTLRALNN